MSGINYICNMKWLHNLLRGFSLTGALFVFQACYGMPEPPDYEETEFAPMSFSVVSHTTGAPVEGIRISGSAISRDYGMLSLGVTDENGKCLVQIPYRRDLSDPVLVFEDRSGNYATKDTTLADLSQREILIKMDPSR